MRNFIYFLVGFALAFFCGLAFASLPVATPTYSRVPLPGYQPTITGFYANPAAFQDGINAQTFVKSVPFDIVTSRGTVPATVPVTINANIPRLASSVGSFALKLLSYAGAAVALYDLTCDLTSYCHDSSLPSGFGVTASPPAGWTIDGSGILHAPSTTSATYTTPAGADVCQWLYDSTGVGNGGWCINRDMGIPYCRVETCNGSHLYQTHCCFASAPEGYTWNGGSTNTASKTGSVPNDNTASGLRDSTEADRIALSSNTALNTASVVSKLAAAGEPVPIDDPVASSVSVTGPSSDIVNRDSAGNPTSTTRTQTNQNITPAPVSGDPLRVQIQETTTTTTINNAGDVISSSTTTINTPPESEPEKDSTVKFDDPVPLAIPSAEIPNEYTAQNWGSSATCPSDPVLNVPGGFTITLPVHVACDAMEYMKPVVLLVASMAAGLIIMGAVKS